MSSPTKRSLKLCATRASVDLVGPSMSSDSRRASLFVVASVNGVVCSVIELMFGMFRLVLDGLRCCDAPCWVLVFEGFFDFLSLVMLEGRKPDATVIVLNSVSKRESAVEAIRKLNPNIVELYPDHDVTGRELVEYFKSGLPNSDVIDKSAFYLGYDDLNDWFANRKLERRKG